eukprot:TRINITY_DN75473_c0_g1_i1.p1 TRINITY_DN75473_c0_g1~~TRINITY_DN75473_c0_g1_i1.p1  ORF type:complete len:581 (-),score=97.09 TRINITY_DN75473_c0_g1_i1:126-1868(-)
MRALTLVLSSVLLLCLCIPVVVSRKRVFGRRSSSSYSAARPDLLAAVAALPRLHSLDYDERLAERHRVSSLPGLPFGYDAPMYAGHISVHEPRLQNNGSFFYWLVESKHKPEESPLIIWVNGGPGCSSLEGLLIEHGPFLAVATGFDLELNAYAWNRKANVLYIDQPVGTGFAFAVDGVYARSQDEVNVMFMAFLQRWFRVHSRYAGRPMYLAGESYAGRYIPHFAHQIIAAGSPFNLEGVMIGNGWTHPIVQSESFADFSASSGLISAQQKRDLDTLVAECRAVYDQDPYSKETYNVCERIQTSIPDLSGDTQIGKLNMYDVRLYDTTAGGDWPWRTTGEVSYLNRADVQKALHVEHNLGWSECSDAVEEYLTHEDMYPTIDEFRTLLPHMRVLVYNGQFDWICNHLGVEHFLDAMEFEGKTTFSDPRLRGEWVSGSRLAGYVKHGGNLTFLLVLGGSHMVPMDKRPQTLDMVERFIHKKPFADVKALGLEFEMVADPPPIAEAARSAPRGEEPVAPAALSATFGQTAPMWLDTRGLLLMLVGVVLGVSLRPCGRRALRWFRAARPVQECSNKYEAMLA